MIEVNPYGTVFSGPQVTVEMATLQTKNSDGSHDILLKVLGAPAFAAGIDGKTIRYAAEASGTSQNFSFLEEGRRAVRLTWRDGTQVSGTADLFLGGKKYSLRIDKEKSEQLRPVLLLNEYKAYLENAPSRLAIERSLLVVVNESKEGGWAGQGIILKWSGHEALPEARYTMGAAVEGLAVTMKDLLGDKLGRDALATLGQITLDARAGFDFVVEKNQDQMIIGIGVLSGVSGMGKLLSRELQKRL